MVNDEDYNEYYFIKKIMSEKKYRHLSKVIRVVIINIGTILK